MHRAHQLGFGGIMREVSRRLSIVAPGNLRGASQFRRVLGRALAGALMVASGWLSLAEAAPPPVRGTSTRAARQEAIAALPMDKLDAGSREKVEGVLGHVSLFRRLPVQSVGCDPELYTFIVNHPEIIANIWQLLGMEDVVLDPTGPDTYRAADGVGTEGSVEFLYRDHDTHLIYAEGSYDGPLFTQPVRGKCILALKSAFVREPDGRYFVTTRLDAFISLEHVGADFLARTFHPLVGKVADYNFVTTSQFMGNLAQAAETNPVGIHRLAERLIHIRPETREQFVALADQVADRAISRGVRQAQAIQRTPAPTAPVMRAQAPGPMLRR